MEGSFQLALFDSASEESAPERTTAKELPHEGLEDIAFLYTATEKGNNSGIRFAMTKEDAMKWCDSPISMGVLHGTEWAYFWTLVRSFIESHDLYPEENRHSLISGRPRIDIRKLIDNGQWDERIASLGLRKISFPEFRSVFEPMGIEVLQ